MAAITNTETFLQSLFAANNPKSLIVSQLSDSPITPITPKPQIPQLKIDNFEFERGPRYKEYSDLRDKRLRMKNFTDQQQQKGITDQSLQIRSLLTPPKKQVKFTENFTPPIKQVKFQGYNCNFATPPKKPKGGSSSILAQSVPDFSSALRKENRKPLPPVAERSKTLLKSGGKAAAAGSRSTSSVEKKSGGLTARKSYASMEELKVLASGARNAINGGGTSGKTILGSSRYF